MIQEMGSKLATAVVNEHPKLKEYGIKATMKDEAAQALQAQRIVDDTVPLTGWMVGQSLWTLLINNTKTPFWTSDNPVLIHWVSDSGGIGFNVKGIQTHFPITSKLLLRVLDPTSYSSPPIKLAKEERRARGERATTLQRDSICV